MNASCDSIGNYYIMNEKDIQHFLRKMQKWWENPVLVLIQNVHEVLEVRPASSWISVLIQNVPDVLTLKPAMVEPEFVYFPLELLFSKTDIFQPPFNISAMSFIEIWRYIYALQNGCLRILNFETSWFDFFFRSWNLI